MYIGYIQSEPINESAAVGYVYNGVHNQSFDLKT